VLHGTGRFVSANVLEVMARAARSVSVSINGIIAAGSEPVRLPGLPQDPRILDSTDALELPESSGGLLVVGGGIIGLELACVFDALGRRVSVVELTPQLMPGTDPDLVRPLERRIRARYQQILLGTSVAGHRARVRRAAREFRGREGASPADFRARAGGRRARPKRQDARRGAGGVSVSNAASFPSTGRCAPTCRTFSRSATSPHRRCWLTRPCTREGGRGSRRRPQARGRLARDSFGAYTDPEIAWVGLTETDARANGTAFRKGAFPWVANGRSLSLGREEGSPSCCSILTITACWRRHRGQ